MLLLLPCPQEEGPSVSERFLQRGRAVGHMRAPLPAPCGSWSPLYPLHGCASCLLHVWLILHLKFLEIITPPFVEFQSLVWSQISGSPLQKKAKHPCRPGNRWGGQSRLWAAPVTPDSQDARTLRPPSANLRDAGSELAGYFYTPSRKHSPN